jgi:hypothetical protein
MTHGRGVGMASSLWRLGAAELGQFWDIDFGGRLAIGEASVYRYFAG